MKKRIINIIRILIVVLACGSFTYASYNLTKSYLGYKTADEAYEEINNMFVQNNSEDEETDSDSDNKNAEKETKTSDSEENNPDYDSTQEKWVWDYNAMLEYNPESVGYIKLDDSRIQYPIVQNLENNYYLTHGSNRISNGNGAIFVDSRIQGGLDAKSCIVYGHDMLDGSMFAGLLDFSDADFCKNHQVFDIYIGYRHYRYYVFASFRADALDEDIYKLGFEDDSDYEAWLNRCYSKSNYSYDYGKPSSDKKTIMLSTCVDDETLRHVVCIVRGEEVVD